MPIEGFQKDEGEIKFHVYVVYWGRKEKWWNFRACAKGRYSLRYRRQ